MKVKIISTYKRVELEDQLNKLLPKIEKQGFNIIDIKLSEDDSNYTAMIIYEKPKINLSERLRR